MASYKDLIGGLIIFSKYDPKGGASHVCAEHDEIWAGHDAAPEKLSAEDAAALDALGWVWDATVDGWRRYT